MDSWQRKWGVTQWSAYFENQPLPVMKSSKRRLAELEAAEGEKLSPRRLTELALGDPLLCLCLMREAERRKSRRLDRATTTALAAVMLLGADEFRDLLLSSAEIDDGNGNGHERDGLRAVTLRARYSSEIAQVWGAGRADINPEELAVAALLSGTGELMLWVYAEEIPRKASDLLARRRARRSAEAQLQACGFTFRELTLQCAERWVLPHLVIQLLRGAESDRARLTRTCTNAARHLLDPTETATLALATDLVEALELIPNSTLEWLIDGLPMLPEERRAPLLETAKQLIYTPPPA